MNQHDNLDLERFDQILTSETTLREDQLPDRLSSILSGLDYARTGELQSHSGIFWALTRAFGCYDQLALACEEYTKTREDDLTFIAALETEHFLIRLRALLDEVAYAIRVRLLETIRGLSTLEGPGPIAYKQFRITTFLKFVGKRPTFCPHLTLLLENNRSEINRYIELRDDITHFRAKALILPGPTMHVGFIGARGTPQTGGVTHVDLLEYINEATIWMWRFLQIDVVDYFRKRVDDGEISFKPLGIGLTRIAMPGLRRFKELLNGLGKV